MPEFNFSYRWPGLASPDLTTVVEQLEARDRELESFIANFACGATGAITWLGSSYSYPLSETYKHTPSIDISGLDVTIAAFSWSGSVVFTGGVLRLIRDTDEFPVVIQAYDFSASSGSYSEVTVPVGGQANTLWWQVIADATESTESGRTLTDLSLTYSGSPNETLTWIPA